MEGFENIFLKLKEEEEKLNEPLSNYSLNKMIFEDESNKANKIYDETLFDNMEVFMIEKDENIELDADEIDNEKIMKKEKEKEEFQSYISKMKNILSDIEANTNEIKLEIELDQKKKEEIAKREIERKKLEEQRQKEEEEKKRKEELLRIQLENQKRQELERLKKLEQERRNNNKGINGFDDFNKSGRNINERLINAGKNYDKIYEEITKIVKNKSLSSKTGRIINVVNDIIINKSTSIKNIDKSIKTLANLLKEVKETKNQELYLYACFCLLKLIISKLNEIDSDVIFENYLITAKIIFSLNCKTLTYMLFQMISNRCPYIIPLKYKKEEYNRLFNGKNVDEVCKLCRDYQYLYFTFLYLDKNKYMNIIENYLSNLEQFSSEDINFLISNSFMSFIDVFGGFIWRNKKNLVLKIKENVIKGLKNELNKLKNPQSKLRPNNQTINLKIEDCFNRLQNNQNTKFIELLNKVIK